MAEQQIADALERILERLGALELSERVREQARREFGG